MTLLLIINLIFFPTIKGSNAVLLPPHQTLYKITTDAEQIANKYLQLLLPKFRSLPAPEICQEILEKSDNIKKKNLNLQISSTGSQMYNAFDPYEPLHIYLSERNTPETVVIDLGKINPTTNRNQFKKPQTLLLEVVNLINEYLEIDTLNIPRFDIFRYSVISSFKKYNPLQLDKKFLLKIPHHNYQHNHYHYLDVSQVRTINISIKPEGDITIIGRHIGADKGTRVHPQVLSPHSRDTLLIATQDEKHPEILHLHSKSGMLGLWINVLKMHPETELLKPFPSRSEALAE